MILSSIVIWVIKSLLIRSFIMTIENITFDIICVWLREDGGIAQKLEKRWNYLNSFVRL